jgi:catalase
MQRRCPVHSPYARDGVMRGDSNYGGAVNYEPNSMGGPVEDAKGKDAECALRLDDAVRRTAPAGHNGTARSVEPTR